jgi:hypothetical protein
MTQDREMRGRLRSVLDQAATDLSCPIKSLTVLADQNDPFRVDTPARHRDGKWLADQIGELVPGTRQRHARGLHYILMGREKPDGRPYETRMRIGSG